VTQAEVSRAAEERLHEPIAILDLCAPSRLVLASLPGRAWLEQRSA
jgi:hypothetical protein